MSKKQRVIPDIRWDGGETNFAVGWYPLIVAPLNVVWRHQRDHLVYDWWLPALRSAYLTQYGFYRFAWSSSRFLQSVRVQEGIQERIHVSSSKSRGMAVKGWVNISLDDEDKKRITEADLAVATMLEDLGSLVFRGYRFSITYDDYSSALQASLVCANPEDPNFEYGLSARHPDPVTALKSLLYKYGISLEKPWSEWVTPRKVDNWS